MKARREKGFSQIEAKTSGHTRASDGKRQTERTHVHRPRSTLAYLLELLLQRFHPILHRLLQKNRIAGTVRSTERQQHGKQKH